MAKDSRLKSHFKYSNRLILVSSLVLSLFGYFMIVSAEMGESTADLNAITSTSLRQIIYLVIGFCGLFILSANGLTKKIKKYYMIIYDIVLVLLLMTRLFKPVGGAYGWIRLGIVTVQPSELAKFVLIVVASQLFSDEIPDQNYKKNFFRFIIMSLIYVGIVFLYQSDFGTALVIAAIAYVCLLVPSIKEVKYLQNRMLILLAFVLILFGFLLTPLGTKFLENFSGLYQIRRFLASANPFIYQYDAGYHLIMSLVSFANGGLFGLGYGKSIHKYMNFPNPSTDFILPVIVEEMGIVGGLLPIVVFYVLLLVPIVAQSYKDPHNSNKIILAGTFMFFLAHFVLNVGGVTGLIPLTGVPLLLISSGGSSLVSCLACLGLCENSIINYNKEKASNESSSR